jgi:hypothetical protein
MIKKKKASKLTIGLDISVVKGGVCIIEGNDILGLQFEFKNSKKKGEYLKVSHYRLGKEEPFSIDEIPAKKKRRILPAESKSKLSSSLRGEMMGEYLYKFLKDKIKNKLTYGIIELPSTGSTNKLMSISRAFGGLENAMNDLNMDIYGYTPTTLKKLVSGNGHASKEQLEAVVRHITGMSFITDDLNDAFLFAYYAMEKDPSFLCRLTEKSKGR